jgi:rRNA-processing protein FCF1
VDTNFILSCLKFGINFADLGVVIEKKYEVFIPSNVISELENLRLNKEDTILRDIALKIIKKYPTLELQGEVDTSLLAFAQKRRSVVCTNDKNLRASLRKEGIPVIFIRKRAYLELDGVIF